MKQDQEKGFTLIEVLVASLILVVGVTIITSSVSQLIGKNFRSQRHTQAVLIAQNKIEELLNDGYDSPNLTDVEGGYEHEFNPITAVGDSNGVFYLYWNIDDLNPIPRSKLISSTVEWNNTEGVREDVTLTTVCVDPSN